MSHFEKRNFNYTDHNLYLKDHTYYSDQYMVKQYLKKHKSLIEVVRISHLEDYQDHMQFNICIEDNLEN